MIDAMHQFRFVVIRVAQPLEIHQRPWKPEKALQRHPDHGLTARLPGGPRLHPGDGRRMIREEIGENAQVIIHAAHHTLGVVLRGRDGRLRGAEPELLIRIEAEILGDLEDLAVLEFTRQAFTMPARNGFVPPHCPLPNRQTIPWLELHHRPKPFDMIHVF